MTGHFFYTFFTIGESVQVYFRITKPYCELPSMSSLAWLTFHAPGTDPNIDCLRSDNELCHSKRGSIGSNMYTVLTVKMDANATIHGNLVHFYLFYITKISTFSQDKSAVMFNRHSFSWFLWTNLAGVVTDSEY